MGVTTSVTSRPPDFFGEMGEELERGHHFVVGFFVAEVDVVYLLKGVEDEETASVLGGVYTVLVIKVGVPKRLEFALFPHFGLSGDRWVICFEGGIVLVERSHYPQLIIVGRVMEYDTSDFDGFRTGEADRETRLEEDFSDSSEVVVLQLADNGGEGLDGGFVFGGNI